jgi:hypothetical protein
MKYKVYEVTTDSETNKATFTEVEFNWDCGFDTIEEAYDRIQSRGDDYVHYTILPYVCMTN